MKSIKCLVAATVFASALFVSEQAPVQEIELKQDIAGVCPTWPICRDVNYSEQDSDVILPKATSRVINKTV